MAVSTRYRFGRDVTENIAWFDELVVLGAQAMPTTVIQSGEQHHVIVGCDIAKIEHILQD